MYSRDYRDIIGGSTMAAFGLWFSWYAAGHYNRGTMMNVGDGMFPIALGIMFAFFGLVIAAMAFTRPGGKVEFRFSTAFWVLLGVASFAVTIKPFGLIPAVVSLTVLSAFADLKKFTPLSMILLCIVLSVMIYVIFRLGLGLAVPLIEWPF